MEFKPNEQQRQVIEETESPLLVIAGPGAGKTKTLVDRVIHLIVDKHIDASNIMLATFTEKAAKELVTRISNNAQDLGVSINMSDMYIGTLHSIFFRMLEEYRQHINLKRNYRIIDEFEQRYLIFRKEKAFSSIQNISSLTKQYGWRFAEDISTCVNKVAEENLDLGKLSSCTTSPLLPILSDVTKVYRELLEAENVLDFSLIQSYMWRMLEDDYVLNSLRNKIQYIMVDEYQDTNRIQEAILLKLAFPKNKICVVGDDDQAIYRFRGATVENILRFQENFKVGECKRVELINNYRSHPDIIGFYNKWMTTPYKGKKESGSWNGENGERFRYNKIIRNVGKQNRENSKYPGVVKVTGETIESWFGEIYGFITFLRNSGKISDLNQVTFLCKSVKNPKIVGLANYLEKKGIPVFSPRSDMFFDRREIKLIVGVFVFLFPNLINNYLKNNSTDNEKPIWRYYEECAKFFGDELRKEQEKNKSLLIWAVSKAKELSSLRENTNYTFADLFYEVLQFPLFSEMVNVNLDSGVQDLRPIYNLALFSRLIAKFEFLTGIIVLRPDYIKKDLRNFFNYYLNFLWDGGLGEYEDFDMITPSGCISFMTIHQSKGLEFPITCVDSLDNVPRKEFDQIDEDIANIYYEKVPWEPLERTKYFDFWRLYYTAFSRAKNLLVLTCVENTTTREKGERKSPSKYFGKILFEVNDWTLLQKGYPCFVLDKVEKTNIKHEYSFTSHILLYENCPIQYKFFRELEFTPVRTNGVMFGTLVHQTIEDVHRVVLEGHPEQVTEENMYHWMRENYGQLTKKTGLYLRNSALNVIMKHVKQYVDYAKKDWSRIKEAEVPVALQKENYILEGKIDLIQGHDGTVEILDFKTEKKPDINSDEGREKLRRYRRQLEIYAHIIEGRYGRKVSKMHLYYTGVDDGNPFISYDYNRNAVNHTIDEVSAIVEKIEKKEFLYNPKKRCNELCHDCDLNSYCNTL